MRPLLEETYSVSRLCGEIREFLSEAFPEVWVSGEVQRLRSSRAGHLYLELVEKGDDDEIVGKLDSVIWRSNNRRIQPLLARAGQALADGQEMRCRGRIDFYEPGGRLQLIVSEVDPTFTLGRLELRRRQTLAALEGAGLLELNRGLALPAVPLDVALVTSEGSAAYHDFVSSLEESGYGFRVRFVHASVQGALAEREIVSALAIAESSGVDCVALVRGGGARSDLAVFDSRAVAEAVARCGVPVLAGLGHQIDQSVVDRVANRSLKTPTKAAEFVIERVADSERELDRIAEALRRRALEPLRRGREQLGRAEKSLDLVGLRLSAMRDRLDSLASSIGLMGRSALGRREAERRSVAQRLAAAAPRVVARRAAEPRLLASRLGPAARRRVHVAGERLGSYRRLCDSLTPQRVLKRGFSVTRGADGQVLRRASDVAAGEPITTTLAEGELTSRVEER